LPGGDPFLRLAPGEILYVLACWANLIGHRIGSDDSSGSVPAALNRQPARIRERRRRLAP